MRHDEILEKETEEIYTSMCKRIGEYLNHVRESRGISLKELYRRTNISTPVLSAMENGKKLRYETLLKLNLALGIPLEFMFGTKFAPHSKAKDKPVTVKARKGEIIRNDLLQEGYTKDEVKEIMNFIEFIESKRQK